MRGPKSNQYFAHNAYDAAIETYRQALQAAKDSSIECADQNFAKRLVSPYTPYHSCCTCVEDCHCLEKDTLHPFPSGYSVEVRQEPIIKDKSQFSHYEREVGRQLVTHHKQVAIIKPNYGSDS